jgi:ABC-2 type transport system permease protein
MNRVWTMAKGELRLMLRSRLALIGLVTLLLLSAIAAATSWRQMEQARIAREANQHAADEQFEAQPDRHPHRMVHYGTYAIRPVGPLAAFDPGVDPFTGTVLFLEGHRQNSATFGAARESSSLIRFGQLTPAFVLQTLAPLLLIFLGFASIAREREQGGLRALRVHGASTGQIVAGKSLALGLVALLAAAPALIALAVAGLRFPGESWVSLLVGLGYVAYLLVWVLLIVAGSALARSSQATLIGLIACWAVAIIFVPRGAAAWASIAAPLPSRAETDLRIQADLRRLGDSHNPDDPFFAAFKRRMLQQYGVTRTEDLPINFRGAVSAEGEALTSKLFRNYAAQAATIQRAQVAQMSALAWISPALAVRRASMLGAATDLDTHLEFLRQAEAYRFDMVQRLNRMHAELVDAKTDAARSRDPEAERRSRISAANWSAIPDFDFAVQSAQQRAGAMVPSLAMLAAWLVAVSALAVFAARRLARADG